MNDDDFAQLLANYSSKSNNEVNSMPDNSNDSDFEALLKQAATPQVVSKPTEVPKPMVVDNNNGSDFMAQLMSFNQPPTVIPTPPTPVKTEVRSQEVIPQVQVAKQVIPTGPSAFDLFEKEQHKINEANLKEAKRLQRIEDARIEAINEQTRKEIELEDKKRYSSYDESSGWFDPSALDTAARFISNINSIDSKTRNYIRAVYHIKANFIGHLDTTELMLRFKSPISKIKLYMEMLENALPVR
jgi:hypothetical protein